MGKVTYLDLSQKGKFVTKLFHDIEDAKEFAYSLKEWNRREKVIYTNIQVEKA